MGRPRRFLAIPLLALGGIQFYRVTCRHLVELIGYAAAIAPVFFLTYQRAVKRGFRFRRFPRYPLRSTISPHQVAGLAYRLRRIRETRKAPYMARPRHARGRGIRFGKRHRRTRIRLGVKVRPRGPVAR